MVHVCPVLKIYIDNLQILKGIHVLNNVINKVIHFYKIIKYNYK